MHKVGDGQCTAVQSNISVNSSLTSAAVSPQGALNILQEHASSRTSRWQQRAPQARMMTCLPERSSHASHIASSSSIQIGTPRPIWLRSRSRACAVPSKEGIAYTTRLPRLQDYGRRRPHQGRSAGEARSRRPHNAGNRSDWQRSSIRSLGSARGSACIVPTAVIRIVCWNACANSRMHQQTQRTVA